MRNQLILSTNCFINEKFHNTSEVLEIMNQGVDIPEIPEICFP